MQFCYYIVFASDLAFKTRREGAVAVGFAKNDATETRSRYRRSSPAHGHDINIGRSRLRLGTRRAYHPTRAYYTTHTRFVSVFNDLTTLSRTLGGYDDENLSGAFNGRRAHGWRVGILRTRRHRRHTAVRGVRSQPLRYTRVLL